MGSAPVPALGSAANKEALGPRGRQWQLSRGGLLREKSPGDTCAAELPYCILCASSPRVSCRAKAHHSQPHEHSCRIRWTPSSRPSVKKLCLGPSSSLVDLRTGL